MNLSQFDGLNALLLDVPRLVGLFEQRKATFATEVKVWLSQVELVMQSARLGVVASIAAAHASIVAAEAGAKRPDLGLPDRATKRKVRDLVTARALDDAQATVVSATDDARTTFEQSTRALSGLLASASRKGLLNNGLQPPFATDKLRGLWSQIVVDDDLGSAASQVLALVGFNDTLVLVQRILTSWLRDQVRPVAPHD